MTSLYPSWGASVHMLFMSGIQKSLTGILQVSALLQQDKRVCFYISVLYKDAYILSGSLALFFTSVLSFYCYYAHLCLLITLNVAVRVTEMYKEQTLNKRITIGIL